MYGASTADIVLGLGYNEYYTLKRGPRDGAASQ